VEVSLPKRVNFQELVDYVVVEYYTFLSVLFHLRVEYNIVENDTFHSGFIQIGGKLDGRRSHFISTKFRQITELVNGVFTLPKSGNFQQLVDYMVVEYYTLCSVIPHLRVEYNTVENDTFLSGFIMTGGKLDGGRSHFINTKFNQTVE